MVVHALQHDCFGARRNLLQLGLVGKYGKHPRLGIHCARRLGSQLNQFFNDLALYRAATAGAKLIACVPCCQRELLASDYKMPGLAHSGSVSKTAIITGALFGTLSHVVLDGLMHYDIHPLSPFSQENPFIGLISHDDVYQACTIAGVLGAAGWLFMKWAYRARQAKGGCVASKPSAPYP